MNGDVAANCESGVTAEQKTFGRYQNEINKERDGVSLNSMDGSMYFIFIFVNCKGNNCCTF